MAFGATSGIQFSHLKRKISIFLSGWLNGKYKKKWLVCEWYLKYTCILRKRCLRVRSVVRSFWRHKSIRLFWDYNTPQLLKKEGEVRLYVKLMHTEEEIPENSRCLQHQDCGLKPQGTHLLSHLCI